MPKREQTGLCKTGFHEMYTCNPYSTDCHLNDFDSINWRDACHVASKYTKSTRILEFQYKFLHRRIATNDFLYLSNIQRCRPGILLKPVFHRSQRYKLQLVVSLPERSLATLHHHLLLPFAGLQQGFIRYLQEYRRHLQAYRRSPSLPKSSTPSFNVSRML